MKPVAKRFCRWLAPLCALLTIAAPGAKAEPVAGEVIGRNIFGVGYDYRDEPVLIDGRALIYPGPRFSARLARVDTENTNTSSEFEFNVFSHAIGGIYLTALDAGSGTPWDTWHLALDEVGGLAYPGPLHRTAWNTLLIGESRAVDAARREAFVETYAPYFKHKPDLVDPYAYGWLSELVLLDAEGQAKLIKSYALGRLFAEKVVVMPDDRTVYLLDADDFDRLYLFVAERPQTLSQGRLYAVGRDAEGLHLTDLGTSSALRTKFRLGRIDFDTLFEHTEVLDGSCPQPYRHTLTAFAEECLKIVAKARKYIAAFEPQRFLAMQDAPGFATGLSDIIHDPAGRRLTLVDDEGRRLDYRLGPDEETDSQYVLQEVP